MYRLNQDGKEKFWTNGSSKIMRFMDDVKPRTWIRISRNKWMNKDGNEDQSKSAYSVDELSEKGTIVRPFECPPDIEKSGSLNDTRVDKEKSWDE